MSDDASLPPRVRKRLEQEAAAAAEHAAKTSRIRDTAPTVPVAHGLPSSAPEVALAWQRAATAPELDAGRYRKDRFGAWMHREKFDATGGNMCWTLVGSSRGWMAINAKNLQEGQPMAAVTAEGVLNVAVPTASST